MSPDPSPQAAARALLAFWRAAGVDMDEAEMIYAAAPQTALQGAPNASSGQFSGQVSGAKEPLRQQAASAAPRARGPNWAEQARTLAAKAQSIAELRAAVESFDGCGLKATARTTVFSDGLDDARVLVIGEAPGKDEDERGKPFVGRSGQLLDRMLAAVGLDRKTNLLISNTIYWRPPGNRDPTQGEILVCMPFVERLIQLAKPQMLILVGKTAAQTVLRRDDSMSRLRGRRLLYGKAAENSPDGGRDAPRSGSNGHSVNTMVMLHPAYLLRRPQEKRAAWGDLLLLEAWLNELGVERLPRL